MQTEVVISRPVSGYQACVSEISGVMDRALVLDDTRLDEFLDSSVKAIREGHFLNAQVENSKAPTQRDFERAFLGVSMKVFAAREPEDPVYERKIEILEKILNKVDDKSPKFASVLQFMLRNRHAPKTDFNMISEGAAAVAKFGVGAVTGYAGVELAQRYAGVSPEVQVGLSAGILAALAVRRGLGEAGRVLDARVPGFANSKTADVLRGADGFADSAELWLAGIGAGVGIHAITESLHSQATLVNHEPVKVQGSSAGGKHEASPGTPSTLKPSKPGAGTQNGQPSAVATPKPEAPSKIPPSASTPSTVSPPGPETPVVSLPAIEPSVFTYTITGKEIGGLTNVLSAFGRDPYGSAMTRFILLNANVLENPSHKGHEAVIALINFLNANPTYTWRDAMNASSAQGKASDISKLFTEALKFIRPGTVFQIPQN